MTDYQLHLSIAMFVAGITASYGSGYQYQSLFYIIVVAFAVPDLFALTVLTFWHVVICFLGGLIRSATK